MCDRRRCTHLVEHAPSVVAVHAADHDGVVVGQLLLLLHLVGLAAKQFIYYSLEQS